jgi:DNA polymerase
MHEGITDYLEIMSLAGVTEVKKPNKRGATVGAPPVVKVEKPVATPTEGLVSPAPVPSALAPAVPVPIVSVPEYRLNGDASKGEQLRSLAEEVAKCAQCKDLAASRTQTVFGVGNPDSPLVFLGEAPGADEDKRGEPFVGRAGQLLTDIITKGMLLQRKDVYICNILRCRPPGNRNPLPDEAAHCRPFLDRTLEIIQPKFICCLGAVAAKSLLASEKTIGALRGRVWEYNGTKVICTYHPAYLLRNPAAKKDTWNDIQLLMREMGMR